MHHLTHILYDYVAGLMVLATVFLLSPVPVPLVALLGILLIGFVLGGVVAVKTGRHLAQHIDRDPLDPPQPD